MLSIECTTACVNLWLNSRVKVSEGNCGVRTELCMLNTCMSVLSVSAYSVA